MSYCHGDGIGPEIIPEAVKVLDSVNNSLSLGLTTETHSFGGAAYDETGEPLPDATLAACQSADAVLMGAIGGPQYEQIERDKQSGTRIAPAAFRTRPVCQFAPGAALR